MIPLRHAPDTLRSQLLPFEVTASCRLGITFRARLSTLTLVLAPPRSSMGSVLRLLPYMIAARSQSDAGFRLATPSLVCLYFRTEELLRFRARGHLSTTPFTFAVRRSPFDDLRTPAARPNTLRCPFSPHAAGDSRDVRVSFNAHPRMPHSDRVRAHLSTPTFAFAARCTPLRRTPLCLRSPHPLVGC